jgi:cytidylate kinase
VAERVSRALGFHYLDSGALYRLVALLALERGMALENEAGLAGLAAGLEPRFGGGRVELNGRDVSGEIRQEPVSQAASQVAVHPRVRQALLDLQRGRRRPPGLVADGRDMGTVVFPDAPLKIFLTASVDARADRRYKQLIEKGFPANIAVLAQELRARDKRDSERAASPLKPAQDAYLLDSSGLTIDEVVAQILDWYAGRDEG